MNAYPENETSSTVTTAPSTPSTSMSIRQNPPTCALALDDQGNRVFYILEPGKVIRETIDSELSEGFNTMSLNTNSAGGQDHNSFRRPRSDQVSSATAGSPLSIDSRPAISAVPTANGHLINLGETSGQMSQVNGVSNEASNLVKVGVRQITESNTNPQRSPHGTLWVSRTNPNIPAQSGTPTLSARSTPNEIYQLTNSAEPTLERDGYIILSSKAEPNTQSIPDDAFYMVDGHPVRDLDPTLMRSTLSQVRTHEGYHEKLESILAGRGPVSREDFAATLMRPSTLYKQHKQQLHELKQSSSDREQYIVSLEDRLAAVSAISQAYIDNLTDVLDDASSDVNDSIHSKASLTLNPHPDW